MKLMLADDHPLFLEGLQYLLETNGIPVVGRAVNGKEAYEKARELRPDIILMDIRMPECSGLDSLKLIKAEMPEIKVVMLTTSDEDDDLFEAIRCGASGYLLKNISAEELLGMLSDLQSNGVPLSPGLAARLLKELRKTGEPEGTVSSEPAKVFALTERQTKILERVAKGFTYKEIGEAFGLSERTIKYHMARIIELLHVENRAQVIAYAARMGLTGKK